MLKKLLSVFLLIIFFTAPAMGREDNGLPHGKWWNNAEVVGQLNLTDKEVKMLDDMYVSHRRKIIKLYAGVEIEQFELNNLIDSKTLDDEAVLNQSKRLEQARSVLSTERFQFFLDIRKLLGFDRYQQLKSMYRSLRHNKKYDRFKNKMYKRHDGAQQLRPSSYKDSSHFQKPDYRNDKDMDNPELIEQPTPDISPYNNNKDLSGENL